MVDGPPRGAGGTAGVGAKKSAEFQATEGTRARQRGAEAVLFAYQELGGNAFFNECVTLFNECSTWVLFTRDVSTNAGVRFGLFWNLCMFHGWWVARIHLQVSESIPCF